MIASVSKGNSISGPAMPVGAKDWVMPFQNRVDPFGKLVATSAKGSLMGNRGHLHDAKKQIVRTAGTTRSWVTCALAHAGWHQEIMASNGYTQLFFLDEATALSAGHRPCATCRRGRFNEFRTSWAKAQAWPAERRLNVTDIDPVMQRDRNAPVLDRPIHAEDVPNGAMVTTSNREIAWLKWKDFYRPWSFDGYGAPQTLPEGKPLLLLTPPSTAEAIRAGYVPGVHLTAQN